MTARSPLARVADGISDALLVLVLLVVIGSIVLGVIGVLPFGFSYLLFVLLTIFVVRSVPVEPGAFLGLRTVRRLLVLVIGLITIDFLFVNGLDLPTLGALVLCDFALGRATRRLAGARDDVLDERQSSWRNRAYRIAYATLALAVGSVLVVCTFASAGTRQWLAEALQHGGAFVSFIQLVAFLPSMVIAWTEPDRIAGADLPRLRQSLLARIAAAMVVLCLVVPLPLSASIALAPVRTSAFVKPASELGRTIPDCVYFGSGQQVGVGFGATVSISAVGCWNGRTAYESWGMNFSDCLQSAADFATVSTLECRRVTQPDGTLRFTYRARVRSAFLPFVTRDVASTLELTKNGKVVEFP